MAVLEGDDDERDPLIGVERILLGRSSTSRMGYLTSGGPIKETPAHPVRGARSFREHPDSTVSTEVRLLNEINEYLRENYLGDSVARRNLSGSYLGAEHQPSGKVEVPGAVLGQRKNGRSTDAVNGKAV